MFSHNSRRLTRGQMCFVTLLTLSGATIYAGRVAASAAVPTPAPSTVDILQVRSDVYMLTVEGVNVAVETGEDGTIVVDPGPATSAEALLSAIRSVSHSPIRYIVDTGLDAALISGNQRVAEAGYSFVNTQLGRAAPIIAREEVLLTMLNRPGEHPATSLPSELFTRAQYNLYLNGQGVEVISEPAATSKGDAVVLFRRSDVVVTGGVVDLEHFPVIDLKVGGSIQGEIDALEQLTSQLALAPTPLLQRWDRTDDGTMVIPARGHLCSHADLVRYRDMVLTVTQRVQALMDEGKSLAQIRAARPTQGFSTRYLPGPGEWSGDRFVDAIFNSRREQEHSHGRSK